MQKNLTEIPVMINDTFYRGQYILEYIRTHTLTEVDKEAIKATIMDALHESNFQINGNKNYSLDFKHLCLVDNLNFYCYESTPNIMGIPFAIKKALRNKTIRLTGGIPVSTYITLPNKNRCIYDLNTSVSSIFTDFSFIKANYQSLTREGEQVYNRPFLQINYNGEEYLVDTLTKRIIKLSYFQQSFALEIIKSDSLKEFNGEKQAYYQEQTEEFLNFIPLSMTMHIKIDSDEYQYELKKAKEEYSEEWYQQEIEIQEMHRYLKTNAKRK